MTDRVVPSPTKPEPQYLWPLFEIVAPATDYRWWLGQKAVADYIAELEKRNS